MIVSIIIRDGQLTIKMVADKRQVTIFGYVYK